LQIINNGIKEIEKEVKIMAYQIESMDTGEKNWFFKTKKEAKAYIKNNKRYAPKTTKRMRIIRITKKTKPLGINVRRA
jgi:hypothetical protein